MITNEALTMEKSEEPKWFSEPQNLAQFLSSMSHEIRTPIGAVLGFTDLLKGPALDAKERNCYLEVIGRNSRQLHELIEKILDVAKIETGSLPLEHSPVSIISQLNDIIELFRFEGCKKDIEFVIYPVSANFPKVLYSDPVRIQQILHELIESAVHTATEGQIQISALSQDDKITICLEHSGIALISDSLNNIFAKILARALGGDIRMFQKGSNTVYFITLPLSNYSDRNSDV